MTMNNSDLEAMLLQATRGSGGAKMITKQELLDLYVFAAKQGMMIDGIEPFRCEEKFDIPHVELTITASEIHESHATLSWDQKIAAMEGIIVDLIQKTEKIGGEFRFNAWVSQKEDWPPETAN